MATQLVLLTAAVLAVLAAVLPIALGKGPPNLCHTTTTGFYPSPYDCYSFFHCSNGIPYYKKCPYSLHWSNDPLYPGCVFKYSERDTCVLNNLDRECANANSKFKIANPDDCASYYDCSLGKGKDKVASKQKCPSNKLFDTTTKRCVYKKWAWCGSRPIPKA